MRQRCLTIVGLSLGLVLLTGAPAWATIQNVKSLKQAYPGKEAKAYSCKACHEGAVGKATDLNTYGLALQQHKGVGNAKTLTVEDYQAVEKADPKVVPAGLQSAPQTPPAEGKPSSRAPDDTNQRQALLDELVTPSAWAADQPAAAEEKKSAAAAPAAAKAEAPKEKTASAKPQAEYVGMDTCVGCHPKQAEEFKHSTHSRIMVPGDKDKVGVQGCETCHGPGSLHAEAGGGRGVGGIINPRKDPSTCFACHLDKKAEFRLPYHHPVLEGKMSCADCHNAHGEDVRPWSATSMKDVNEACYKCHKDQRGPFVWEHEALREGCATCHKIHGSIHEKMLIARDANLCLRCHTQVGFPVIGKSSHATRIPQGTCFSAGCHTAVHGSNFDDHLRY